jgi:hypothetical protein
MSIPSTFQRLSACAVIAMAQIALHAQAPAARLSLKFGNETVPPGGIVQAKLFVTEPMPISTATAGFSLGGVESLSGIAVRSRAHDALAVAVVKGSQVTLSMLSPSATFGLDPDYPVLMISGRVPVATAIGTRFALTMDAASMQFTDGTGAVYPATMSPGSLLVAPNVNVDDVTPGSGDLASGGAFVVIGRGFTPGTKVKTKEVIVSDVSYLDASHMRVTVAQPVHMHGAGIRVTNLDGSQTKYVSYQRTLPQAVSANPTLHDAVPVFADLDVTRALVDVRGHTTGLALQNRQAADVVVSAALLAADGRQAGQASVRLGPSRSLLLDLSELFGVSYAPSQTVQVSATAPIQVMGVAVDAAGRATPIPFR